MADTVLASLEPEAREYREHDGAGLYLRVKPDGSKSWQFRYKRPDGKWSWLGLGAFGKGTHQLSGEQARREAAKIREDVTQGADPTTMRQARAAEQQAETFESLAREWLDSKRTGWTEGTAKRAISALQRHVFPVFGAQPYRSITPMRWMEHFRRMEDTGILEQTSRVRGLCRDVYDLARVTGRAESNPCEGLHKFLQTHQGQNFAHVPHSELPALLRAIRGYGTPGIRIGLQLLSMLACRPSELRCARWSEFDLSAGLWLIPAQRMKRRREHLIPLPAQALQLLHELHRLSGAYPLLFPGRSDTTKPRSNTAFLMALRRLGYQGRQTGHGFRHLASTILNESGFDPQHVEAQLSHVKEGVRGVYDKSTYLEQRRRMMQWYADHLDKLAAGNVIELSQRPKMGARA